MRDEGGVDGAGEGRPAGDPSAGGRGPEPPARPPRRRAYGCAARGLGLGAVILLVGVLAGVLLPGTWTASATRVLPAPPDAVLPWLDSPRSWESWTPAGDVAFRYEGPARGPGAVRSWDDPGYGQGTFSIVESASGLVAYQVTVQGSLMTRGRLTLEPGREGTRVEWTEEGDFGWNPLLGYQALFMERGQGALMDASLARLEELLASGATPPEDAAAPPPEASPAPPPAGQASGS